jgi:hypothetical protein
MDDERIRQLRDETLAALSEATRPSPGEATIPARVAALEDAVRALQAGMSGAAAAVAVVHAPRGAPPSARGEHPGLRPLDVPGGAGGPCVLEPDKPCIESGRCRAFGH